MAIKPKYLKYKYLALSLFLLLGGVNPGNAALFPQKQTQEKKVLPDKEIFVNQTINKTVAKTDIVEYQKPSLVEDLSNALPNTLICHEGICNNQPPQTHQQQKQTYDKPSVLIAAKKSRNSDVTNSKVLHLINRLSFGVSPGDVDKVNKMGFKRYIKQQLSPSTIPEPQILTNQLRKLKTLNLNYRQIYSQYKPPRGKKLTREEQKALNKRSRLLKGEARKARLLRAVHSDRQLQEVMVDFWYNHFNVYGGKEDTRLLVGAYERDAIRPNVFGKFRDLLEATARHPAMLIYLDNRLNTDPDSPKARGRRKGLNENYARELMELHTLGVDGGYTQKDVISLARLLTGWGITRNPQKMQRGGFYFDSQRHDFSDKVFLGKNVQGSGENEVEQALDILARHPSTARHISYKLAQYFVADNPPKSLVKRLSKRFMKTDGNIKAVLYTLFNSKEFWEQKYFNSKFKTPLQYVVSVTRAADIKVRNPGRINGFLGQSGMHLYQCLLPDGYKNTRDAWLSTDSISRRLSFVTNFANGQYRYLEIPKNQAKNRQRKLRKPLDAEKLANTLENYFSNRTQKAIASSPPRLHAAMMLGSPEFMHR